METYFAKTVKNEYDSFYSLKLNYLKAKNIKRERAQAGMNKKKVDNNVIQLESK